MKKGATISEELLFERNIRHRRNRERSIRRHKLEDFLTSFHLKEKPAIKLAKLSWWRRFIAWLRKL